jgi:hypothetical protein
LLVARNQSLTADSTTDRCVAAQAYTLYLHSGERMRMPLNWLIIDPYEHNVHHYYGFKNYNFALCVWCHTICYTVLFLRTRVTPAWRGFVCVVHAARGVLARACTCM